MRAETGQAQRERRGGRRVEERLQLPPPRAHTHGIFELARVPLGVAEVLGRVKYLDADGVVLRQSRHTHTQTHTELGRNTKSGGEPARAAHNMELIGRGRAKTFEALACETAGFDGTGSQAGGVLEGWRSMGRGPRA